MGYARTMTPERTDVDRSLDEEGIPDLEAPLDAKVATGDGQEGVPPPSVKPASLDYGTTAAEQRRGEPISERTKREQPDPALETDDDELRPALDDVELEATMDDAPPVEPEVSLDAPDEPRNLVLVDDANEDGEDVEKDLMADVAEDEPSLAAEEAAIHVVDDAPGAVDRPDSYLEDVPE